MFEPISARLASSCSRNGIRPAETPTICFGETSMYSILSAGTSTKSPRCRAMTRVALRSCRSRSACRPGRGSRFDSSSARSHTTSSVSLPFLTLRYGVIRKPYSSTAGVDRQARDQTDVRAFRRLDRADAAVVRNVHVAHFEAGPLAVQAARARGPTAAARASAATAGSSGRRPATVRRGRRSTRSPPRCSSG